MNTSSMESEIEDNIPPRSDHLKNLVINRNQVRPAPHQHVVQPPSEREPPPADKGRPLPLGTNGPVASS